MRIEWRNPFHLFKRHPRVVLIVDGCVHELHPHRRFHMSLQITAGHSVAASIAYLDQNGNPMLTAPTPDSPPAWTNSPSAPGIDTLTVAADGNSAVLATNAADADATDTLGVTVVVAGKSFAASLGISISAAPQVLTSIAIDGVAQ